MNQYIITIIAPPGFESEVIGLGDITKDIKIEIDSMLPSPHLWCEVKRINSETKLKEAKND